MVEGQNTNKCKPAKRTNMKSAMYLYIAINWAHPPRLLAKKTATVIMWVCVVYTSMYIYIYIYILDSHISSSRDVLQNKVIQSEKVATNVLLSGQWRRACSKNYFEPVVRHYHMLSMIEL